MKFSALFLLLISVSISFGQVSTGTTIPEQNFHVHDSASTSSILISTGNITSIGLNLNRTSTNEGNIFNVGGNLNLKGGNTSGIGGEMTLFQNGNIGIGQGLIFADVTSELTVSGSNPLKLMGLNTNHSLDTILVKDKAGTVYERPFKSLFIANSFWSKSENYLSSMDSIGIGTDKPDAPLHITNEENLDVILNSEQNETAIHLQAQGIESIIGQYDLSSTKMLLDGSLSAKGISYFESKFESISSDQTEGILINVENTKPIYLANGGQERFRVHDDGNVHIGVFDNNYKYRLNVNGSSRIADTLFFDDPDFYISEKYDTFNLISDKHMRFKANRLGDFFFENRDSSFVHFDGSRATVGIGIENAVQELEVKGDVLVYDTLYLGSRFNKLYSGANTFLSTLTNLKLKTPYTYDIEILSGNEEYATFEAESKSLGIGTNTPEEKLDVIGTVKADKFKMTTAPSAGKVMTSDADGLASWQDIPNDNDWTKTGTNLFTSSAGTVTIGTTGPATSLFNVQGSISLPIIKTSAPSYIPSPADHTVIMEHLTASIILPIANTCTGRIYVLKFMHTGSSIQTTASNTIEGGPSFIVPASPLSGAFTTIVVQSDGLNGWWIINY